MIVRSLQMSRSGGRGYSGGGRSSFTPPRSVSPTRTVSTPASPTRGASIPQTRAAAPASPARGGTNVYAPKTTNVYGGGGYGGYGGYGGFYGVPGLGLTTALLTGTLIGTSIAGASQPSTVVVQQPAAAAPEPVYVPQPVPVYAPGPQVSPYAAPPISAYGVPPTSPYTVGPQTLYAAPSQPMMPSPVMSPYTAPPSPLAGSTTLLPSVSADTNVQAVYSGLTNPAAPISKVSPYTPGDTMNFAYFLTGAGVPASEVISTDQGTTNSLLTLMKQFDALGRPSGQTAYQAGQRLLA